MMKRRIIISLLFGLFICSPLLAQSRTHRQLRIGSRIGGATPGSLLFIDLNKKLAQDNANLFWDDSNDRLGIGTSTPSQMLQVGTDNTAAIDLGGIIDLFANDAGASKSALMLSDTSGNDVVLRFENNIGISSIFEYKGGQNSHASIVPGAAADVYYFEDGGAARKNIRLYGNSGFIDLSGSVNEFIAHGSGQTLITVKDDTAAESMIMGIAASDGAGFLSRNGTGGTDLEIAANGNTSLGLFGFVGIGGTFTPATLLEVEDGLATTGIQVSNTATDGDPFLAFALGGTKTFTMGVDDGDGDKFKIGTTAIGTNTWMTVDSSQNIGFGTSTPSEKIDINGRLELTQQTGSTNDGAIWNDSTQETLQSFTSGIEQSLVGCIFTQTSDRTIANTTTETTMFGTGVGTLTLPANFWTVGKTIRIEIHGDFADTGNPTAEVQAYYGATSLIDSSAITLSGLADTEEWETHIIMTCRSVGATGTIETIIDWEYETSTGSSAIERLDVAGTTTVIDTTASGALDATFQWGTASASNTLTSEIGLVEVLN